MDGRDNDGDTLVDETGEKTSSATERVIKDVIIRDGKLIAVSMIPVDSPCEGGGTSVIHEISACSGSRLKNPAIDITGDRTVNNKDTVLVNGQNVSVSGISVKGIASDPAITGLPDTDVEMKVFVSHTGEKVIVFEKKEVLGIHYWREVNN